MTREEVIQELQNCKGLIQQDGQDYLDEIDIPLLDMAIEALSAEVEQTNCTKFVNWLLEEVMDEEMWELNAVAYGEVIARKLKKLGLLEVKDGCYIRHIENNTKESDLVYRPSAEAVDVNDVTIHYKPYPSADRPTGEWKPKNHHTDYCSNCGFEETQWRTADYNFCPNCGAKMGGDDE